MNKLSLLLREDDRHIHAAELATEILRELFMATKKLTVYQSDHPQSLASTERPLLLFKKWFRVRRVADIACDGPVLHFAGMEMARGPFTDGLARDLEALKLQQVVFLPHVTGPELLSFLSRLTERVPLANVESYMWNHLKKQSISSIAVNDADWQEALEGQRRYRQQDVCELSVARMVLAECGDRSDLVAAVAAGQLLDPETLQTTYSCFFTPEILGSVLSERFAEIPCADLMRLVSDEFQGLQTELPAMVESTTRLDHLRHLVTAFNHHPQRRELIEGVRQLFNRQKMPAAAYAILDAQSRVQLDVMDELDNYVERIFSTACTTDDLKAYGPAFARLLKCGYSKKPQAIVTDLLGQLKRDDRNARRKAQFLLGQALAATAATQSWALLGWLAGAMARDVVAGEDTYEYSDLLGGAGEQLLTAGRFDMLADLAHRLRELLTDEKRLADGLVARAVLKRWSRLHVVSVLMRVLLEEERGAHGDALKALQAIRGPEVARLAAAQLTHSERRVRLTMIRLLPELGADARNVCVELLAPEALWQRRAGTTSLPDESWYTVRNALHILGRLREPGALAVLRNHLSDPDPRVRFEIVRALERIGGSDALRFLVTLAEDSDRGVRLAAIVAMGATGSEHEVFVLRELFGTDADSAEKIIYAIGHIGGRQAKEFLFALLDGDSEFRNSGLGERAGELREVVLKALAQNPDAEIVEHIERYCREHNRTFRIPVATEKLTETAKHTLRRTHS